MLIFLEFVLWIRTMFSHKDFNLYNEWKSKQLLKMSRFLPWGITTVMKVKVVSDSVTPWTTCQAPLYRILQARILERVAVPFSRGSSQPRDRTQVSCVAGRFLTSWAIREAQESWSGVAYPFSKWIFLTQESNWNLFRCRQSLNQLSYQGSSFLFGEFPTKY